MVAVHDGMAGSAAVNLRLLWITVQELLKSDQANTGILTECQLCHDHSPLNPF